MLDAVSIPRPVSVTVLAPAPVPSDSAPVALPRTVGLKVTLTLHDNPGASETGQLCVDAKGPFVVGVLTETAASPVFFKVTTWAAEVAPTVVPVKFNAETDCDVVGAIPVPVTATDTVGAVLATVRLPG